MGAGMTTKEEYAEAVNNCEMQADRCASNADNFWLPKASESFAIAARVLRQLAEGAVLCDGEWIMDSPFDNRPLHAAIEEQP
jgi:hypothetical protein